MPLFSSRAREAPAEGERIVLVPPTARGRRPGPPIPSVVLHGPAPFVIGFHRDGSKTVAESWASLLDALSVSPRESSRWAVARRARGGYSVTYFPPRERAAWRLDVGASEVLVFRKGRPRGAFPLTALASSPPRSPLPLHVVEHVRGLFAALSLLGLLVAAPRAGV